MRTKYVVFIISILSIGALQATAQAVRPDAVVKKLYTEHNAGRGPFFQTKRRALVDQYFTKKLAAMIWKDAVESKGEVGALGADPLFNAQDTKITVFKVGRPTYGEGNLDVADVEVTFRNFKSPRAFLFRLERDAAKKWKIDNIHYVTDGFSLVELFAGTAVPFTDIEGQLHKGAKDSYILYVGKESGDYAAYCFENDSEVGRAILAACKDGDQCQVKGGMEDGNCKPAGIEADLSASGRIVKIKTVKSRGKKR